MQLTFYRSQRELSRGLWKFYKYSPSRILDYFFHTRFPYARSENRHHCKHAPAPFRPQRILTSSVASGLDSLSTGGFTGFTFGIRFSFPCCLYPYLLLSCFSFYTLNPWSHFQKRLCRNSFPTKPFSFTPYCFASSPCFRFLLFPSHACGLFQLFHFCLFADTSVIQRLFIHFHFVSRNCYCYLRRGLSKRLFTYFFAFSFFVWIVICDSFLQP